MTCICTAKVNCLCLNTVPSVCPAWCIRLWSEIAIFPWTIWTISEDNYNVLNVSHALMVNVMPHSPPDTISAFIHFPRLYGNEPYSIAGGQTSLRTSLSGRWCGCILSLCCLEVTTVSLSSVQKLCSVWFLTKWNNDLKILFLDFVLCFLVSRTR